MMSERIGLPSPSVPSIDDEKSELETDDSFIPPQDSHSFVHPRPHSPPPTPLASATAPVVTGLL
jgi:hypothetical protein